MNPLTGIFPTKLGNFQYEIRNNCVTISLPEGKEAYVRGKAFKRIQIHFTLTDGKWKIDPLAFIERKELMHDVTKTQQEEIKKVLNEAWNTYWNERPVLHMKFKQNVRAIAIENLLNQEQAALRDMSEAQKRLQTIREQLRTYLK